MQKYCFYGECEVSTDGSKRKYIKSNFGLTSGSTNVTGVSTFLSDGQISVKIELVIYAKIIPLKRLWS